MATPISLSRFFCVLYPRVLDFLFFGAWEGRGDEEVMVASVHLWPSSCLPTERLCRVPSALFETCTLRQRCMRFFVDSRHLRSSTPSPKNWRSIAAVFSLAPLTTPCFRYLAKKKCQKVIYFNHWTKGTVLVGGML